MERMCRSALCERPIQIRRSGLTPPLDLTSGSGTSIDLGLRGDRPQLLKPQRTQPFFITQTSSWCCW